MLLNVSPLLTDNSRLQDNSVTVMVRKGVDSDAGLGNRRLTESAALFAGTSINRRDKLGSTNLN